MLAAIGAAAKHDPVRPPVETVAVRGDPTDGIAREKEQVDARVSQLDHAFVLLDVPILIMAHAQERLAFQASIRRQHIAVRAIRDVISLLFQPIRHGEFEAKPLA